ncbi:MAG: hypothetical protein ACXWV0_01185 [Flavisolibacter sp.]
MTNGARTVTDPFNNKIFLVEGICRESPDKLSEIYDDASVVIQKPAMMLEVIREELKEFYYFRSIGWQSTLLIGVHLQNEQWVTFSCEKNPSNEKLSDLLKRGRQLV